MQKDQKRNHVIIVGAGLSGLSAARDILTKQPQTQVTVLEANDYLGGRTKSQMINNCIFDLGGQFIGLSQKYVIDLANQSKNELIPVNDKGKKVVDIKQGYYTYSGNIPNIGSIFSLIDMQILIMKIDRMSKKLPLDNPKNCPLGYKWDTITLQKWMDDNCWSTKVKVMIEGAIRVILGVQLIQISLLHFLYYVRQNKGVQNLISVQNGLQEKKTLKGTQHMSLFLGQKIKEKGGKIILNYVVKSVYQDKDKVVVRNQQGQRIQGNYLIMAMPPPCLSKIQFTPALSNQRKLFCDKSFMGSLAKVLILYPQAYWKQRGFSGEVISDCFDGPAMNVFDNTHINQEGKEQPCLIVFIGGALYRHWKDKPNFQKVLVQKLASYFKEPKMIQPTKIHWHRWQDSNSLGAPVTNYQTGLLSQMQQLRLPSGRIHWAGTQMATVSTGFMDGAIQSGKRAAAEIIQKISQQAETREEKIQKRDASLPYTKWNRSKISWINRIYQWW